MAKGKKPKRHCATATINGTRKYFYGYSKFEAEKKKNDYLFQLKNPKKPLKDIAESWEVEHREEIRPNTWLGYRGHYNAIIEEFGECDIADITRLDIEKTLHRLANLKYSYKTVKAKYNVWNMIFKHALYNGLTEYNPCEQVRIPKGLPKGKRELPNNEEIEKVKSGINYHFGIFAYFLLFTGLRRGEALAVRWEDVDFNTGTIAINKAVTFLNNRPSIQSTKTVNGIRTIPLLAPLRDVLTQRKLDSGYLFGDTKLMTEQAFRRAWERYTKESGATITPHQLRHAYATILFDAEISSKTAQKLLGHADYKTTMEIYTHISEKRAAADMEKLDHFISNF